MTRIGVLAVQGAFAEHEGMLSSLGAECVEIRRPSDLAGGISGLVLPGGESTAQGRLLRELGLLEPLRELVSGGLPVLATCAGLILLADEIEGGEAVHLGTLPVAVRRNAYGRQLGSFVARGEFSGLGAFDMAFIRAPVVVRTKNPGVEILAEVGGRIAAVRHGNQVALAFHPELGSDPRIHALFLGMAEGRA